MYWFISYGTPGTHRAYGASGTLGINLTESQS